MLRPAASDPLLQPPARGYVRVVQRGTAQSATTGDGSAAVPTRSDLCSDSVSSQARMDLLHALQRPVSAGASDDHGSSVTSRSNSSRSIGDLSTGGGATSPAGSSSGAASPDGQVQSLQASPVLPAHASPSTAQHGSLPADTQCDCGAGFGVPQKQQPGYGAEPRSRPHVMPAIQLVQHQQQPPIAWDGASTTPSVAAACSTSCQGCSSSVEQGAGSNTCTAVNEPSSSAAAGAGSSQGGRPDRRATPFLNYDFEAASVV
jgi:hypothetical protein